MTDRQPTRSMSSSAFSMRNRVDEDEEGNDHINMDKLELIYNLDPQHKNQMIHRDTFEKGQFVSSQTKKLKCVPITPKEMFEGYNSNEDQDVVDRQIDVQDALGAALKANFGKKLTGNGLQNLMKQPLTSRNSV